MGEALVLDIINRLAGSVQGNEQQRYQSFLTFEQQMAQAARGGLAEQDLLFNPQAEDQAKGFGKEALGLLNMHRQAALNLRNDPDWQFKNALGTLTASRLQQATQDPNFTGPLRPGEQTRTPTLEDLQQVIQPYYDPVLSGLVKGPKQGNIALGQYQVDAQPELENQRARNAQRLQGIKHQNTLSQQANKQSLDIAKAHTLRLGEIITLRDGQDVTQVRVDALDPDSGGPQVWTELGRGSNFAPATRRTFTRNPDGSMTETEGYTSADLEDMTARRRVTEQLDAANALAFTVKRVRETASKGTVGLRGAFNGFMQDVNAITGPSEQELEAMAKSPAEAEKIKKRLGIFNPDIPATELNLGKLIFQYARAQLDPTGKLSDEDVRKAAEPFKGIYTNERKLRTLLDELELGLVPTVESAQRYPGLLIPPRLAEVAQRFAGQPRGPQIAPTPSPVPPIPPGTQLGNGVEFLGFEAE